jgi:uncharacterized protein DUF1877
VADPRAGRSERGCGRAGAAAGTGVLRPAARPQGAATSPAPPPLELQPGEGDLGPDGDLEKSWQGIHYLLTGTAWESDPPLNFLLAGGREVDIEIGLGPPRVHTAAETRIIASAFAGIDDAELRRRYAPEEMTRLEIYPDIWDRNPAAGLEHVLEGVAILRRGLARVVGQGHGLLIMHT